MTIWSPQLGSHGPRYLAIVEALEHDIELGVLGAGAQLPPQRDLARALDVSLGTVTRAYSLAEERGLVRGEVGRGTFVGPPGLDALPFGDTGEAVAGGINLGMSWPLEHLNPDLGGALRTLQRRADLDALLRYQPNRGMPRHRRAGARWIAEQGLEVEPERVSVCGGGQHAMTVTLSTLARTGDTLLTEEVTYPGVRAVAEFLGLKLHGVAMDDEGILPEAFDQACRQRHPKALYTVPSLQNPTTATQSRERRAAVAEVARRHGVPIVEDAIHHLLIDPTAAPPLLASFAPELTYLIASPSKVVAGGLRVAFLAAPLAAGTVLSQRLWATSWMAPPLVAEVFSAWVEDGTARAVVDRKRAASGERLARTRELLGPIVRESGGRLRAPAAGYHAWLELSEAWPDTHSFVEAVAQLGVVVTGAPAFQVSQIRPRPAVRLSVSAPRSDETLERGLHAVSEALRVPSPVGMPIV